MLFVFWFWAVLGVSSARILLCMPIPGALVQLYITIGIYSDGEHHVDAELPR